MLADLRSYILADAAVTALISTRLHLDRIPANTTYPACQYGMVDEEVMNTHGADSEELNTDLVQIDVYARTASASLSVKEALKARLNSAATTTGTTRFGYIEWQGAFSDYEDDIELFRQTITIDVMWSPV